VGRDAVIDADIMFVVGLVIAVFALPSIAGAFSEHPSRFTIENIPDAFVRVVGHFIN
jgi:hypothetical protein